MPAKKATQCTLQFNVCTWGQYLSCDICLQYSYLSLERSLIGTLDKDKIQSFVTTDTEMQKKKKKSIDQQKSQNYR